MTINNDKKSGLSGMRRILVIIQLCLVFSLILGIMSDPFMKDFFRNKLEGLRYDYLLKSEHIEWFKALPQYDQELIKQDYISLSFRMNRSFFEKFGESFHILFLDLFVFERAWLFFSVLICILLLLRWEGARQTVWILPLITVLFIFENQNLGKAPQQSIESSLYPTENKLLQDYLHEPLVSGITAQKEQLEKGWKLYLVKHWAKQEPSQDVNIFSKQVSEGDYAFRVAQWRASRTEVKEKEFLYRQKSSILVLILELIWNLFFAWIIYFTANERKREIISIQK